MQKVEDIHMMLFHVAMQVLCARMNAGVAAGPRTDTTLNFIPSTETGSPCSIRSRSASPPLLVRGMKLGSSGVERMKIAILGLTATSYGSHTYLKNLLPHLAQIDSTNDYEVFLPATNAEELSVPQANFLVRVPQRAPKSGALRVAWEQLAFPRILRKHDVDIVYTTQNMATLLSSRPSIIIIQNVEPFFAGKFHNPLGKRIRLWLIRVMTELSLKRSKGIIAISDWEKEFLIERFQLAEEKIVVSYPGVTEGFHPPASGSEALLRERWGIEQPYLLCVTRLSGYGNLLNLALAYASLVKAGRLDLPLVIPGEVWDERYIRKVRKLLADEGCVDRVKFIGYVPHREMPLLLATPRALFSLAARSLWDGFD